MLAGWSRIVFVALFLFLAPTGVQAQVQPGTEYETLEGDASITVISATEIEFREGNGPIFVGSYTVSGDRLRMVLTRLGTATSMYFRIDKGSLLDDNGKAYVRRADLQAARAKRYCFSVLQAIEGLIAYQRNASPLFVGSLRDTSYPFRVQDGVSLRVTGRGVRSSGYYVAVASHDHCPEHALFDSAKQKLDMVAAYVADAQFRLAALRVQTENEQERQKEAADRQAREAAARAERDRQEAEQRRLAAEQASRRELARKQTRVIATVINDDGINQTRTITLTDVGINGFVGDEDIPFGDITTILFQDRYGHILIEGPSRYGGKFRREISNRYQPGQLRDFFNKTTSAWNEWKAKFPDQVPRTQ